LISQKTSAMMLNTQADHRLCGTTEVIPTPRRFSTNNLSYEVTHGQTKIPDCAAALISLQPFKMLSVISWLIHTMI